MALGPQHEIYRRRFGRNVGVGLLLVALVGIVFGLTVVKVRHGDPMQAFDHVARPEMIPQDKSGGTN